MWEGVGVRGLLEGRRLIREELHCACPLGTQRHRL